MDPHAAICFEHVSLAFDDQVVLEDVSFELPTGGAVFLLGVSGAGKTVILKLILGLLKPRSGTITVNGQHIEHMDEQGLRGLRGDIGMLFQENALFDSLSVLDNVGYRLYEETDMPQEDVHRRVEEVLGFVGLGEYIDRMPSSLSGGQRRRVAIARAMAARPHLLLLDDPTTGLDPITATSIDDEIVKLRDFEQVTMMLVTHQMRDAMYIATHQAIRENGAARIVTADATVAARARFLVLHEGRIRFAGTASELLADADPFLRSLLYMTLPPW